MRFTHTDTFELEVPAGEITVNVEVTYRAHYDPGVTSGPPDRCYPPDGDLTIIKMTTQSGEPFKPNPEQEALIDARAWEHAENADWGRDDGYD